MSAEDLRAVALAGVACALLAALRGDLIVGAILLVAAAVWWVAFELAQARGERGGP